MGLLKATIYTSHGGNNDLVALVQLPSLPNSVTNLRHVAMVQEIGEEEEEVEVSEKLGERVPLLPSKRELLLHLLIALRPALPVALRELVEVFTVVVLR